MRFFLASTCLYVFAFNWATWIESKGHRSGAGCTPKIVAENCCFAKKHIPNISRLGTEIQEDHFDRGVAWARRAKFNKAIEEFNAAIKLDPKHVVAYFNRGLVWEKKGEPDKAIKDYDQVIRLENEFEQAFYRPTS